MKYDYDMFSRIEFITYPNNRKYKYEREGLGLPTSMQEVNGKTIYDYIYWAATGDMALLFRDGSHSLHPKSNLRGLASEVEIRHELNGALIDRRTYSYDAASNLKFIGAHDDFGNIVLNYDDVNRLTSAEFSDFDNWDFEYSDQDNIKKIKRGSAIDNYVYDVNTQLLNSIDSNNSDIPNREFEYDSTGSMISSDALWPGNGIRDRILTRNSAGQLVQLNDGAITHYEYDANGFRVKKSQNGEIYSVYDSSGKLRFREDTNSNINSEYFYANGDLIARRDSNLSGDAPSGPITGITVVGQVISWPNDGWYQVQETTNYTEICGGGTSCTVPNPGEYKVTNHTTGVNETIVVVGSYTSGITVVGQVISWPNDGWYQVQETTNYTEICGGGTSCTVPNPGEYKVTNHSTGMSENVVVN